MMFDFASGMTGGGEGMVDTGVTESGLDVGGAEEEGAEMKSPNSESEETRRLLRSCDGGVWAGGCC